MRTAARKTYTDHHGIEQPFLEGEELERRNQQLRVVIVKNHCKANEHLNSALDHARQAGDALLEVKRRLSRKEWSEWRQRELIKPKVMSKRTSCVYMSIAANWDHPYVATVRSGMDIDSIAKFLGVLRKMDPDPDDNGKEYSPPGKRETWEERMMEHFAYIRADLKADGEQRRLNEVYPQFLSFAHELAKYPNYCEVFLKAPDKFLGILDQAISKAAQESEKSV